MEFIGIILIIYSSLGLYLLYAKDIDKKQWAQPLLPILSPIIKNGDKGIILGAFILGIGWGFINISTFNDKIKEETNKNTSNVLNLTTNQELVANIIKNEKLNTNIRERTRPTERTERGKFN